MPPASDGKLGEPISFLVISSSDGILVADQRFRDKSSGEAGRRREDKTTQERKIRIAARNRGIRV